MSIWGELALDGARRSVTLEREYPATPAELWGALTEPERLARWLGTLTGTRDGFRLALDEPGEGVDGRVLACEPERRLLVSWRYRAEGVTEAETELEAVLAPAGASRTRLTLVHRRVQALAAADYGAGWQTKLARLGAAVGDAMAAEDYAVALDAYRAEEAALVAGTPERVGDRSGVRIERLLDARPAEVWEALTLPDRIGRWLWPVLSWPDDPVRERPLRLGDVMRLGDANVEGGVQELEVLALEEGRLLRLSWGGAAVSIRLADDEEGTLLTLVQDPIESVYGAGRLRSAPDFAAGWHTLIDQLTLLLAGMPIPDPGPLWEAAYRVYTAD